MKSIHSLALLAGLLIAGAGCGRHSFGGFSTADLTVAAEVTKSGEIAGDVQSIEVVNRFGRVSIAGSATNAAGWTWNLTGRGRTEESAQEAVTAAICTAEREGDTLRLVVQLPDTRSRWSFTSDLDLVVPPTVSVRLRNGFGRSEIIGVKGELDVQTEHGALDLREVSGKVQAGTSFAPLTAIGTGPATLRNQHGRIEVSRVAGELDAQTSFAPLTASEISGKTRLRNQHGRVELQRAPDAEVRTSFGSLAVDGIEGDAVLANEHGRIDAKVGGSLKAGTTFGAMDLEAGGTEIDCRGEHGAVRIRATSGQLARLEARGSFGAMQVQLPAGLSPAIQAKTSFGEIESDFPVLLTPKGQDAFAELEPGTPRITLQNQHGNIRVTKE